VIFSAFFKAEDKSPWGDFWFEPTGSRSLSGARITADNALRLSAVYACVRVLSETFAMLPFVLYRKTGNGGKELVTDHWLYRLLAVRPNEFQNAFEWREMMQAHLAMRGNAYNQIIANYRGEITALIPFHPDSVRIEMMPTNNYRYHVTDRFGKTQILARGDMWHLRGISLDGIIGLNPIQLARDNLGVGMSAQEYAARFYANDAKPSGGWIEFPGNFKDAATKKSFKDSWQETQSGINRGKLAVLEHGMKYHAAEISNDDAQFLETRQFQIAEIARIFRVPPHLIGDLSRATNNNIEQQSRDFVQNTMTPWAERWEASIEADLLLDGEDLEAEFDFANLLRGDTSARSNYYSSGVQNGWLTRNEARIAENLNPLEGLDEPLRPLNLGDNAALEDAEDDAEASEPANPLDQDETDDPAALRMNSLIAGNAARLARRMAKSGDLSASLIAESLAVPLAAAEAWLTSPVAASRSESDLATALLTLGKAT